MGHTFEFLPYVSPDVRESKTVLDSGFHVMDSGFRIPDSNRSLAGSRIYWALYRILKLKIPDSIGKNSLIPESEFP